MPRLLPALLVLLTATPLLGDDYRETEAELEELRERMETVETDLAEQRERRTAVEQELAALERAVGDSIRRLEELDADIERAEVRAGELETAVERERAAAEEHREVLATELRAAYAAGRQQALKLMLNQEDPAAVDRLLVYFDYIQAARGARIDEALAAMADYNEARTALREERDELEALEDEQRERRRTLEERQQEREALLAELEAEIADEDARLERLAEEEAELEALLDELRDALADLPEAEAERQPLAQRQGALTWPVDGGVDAEFGEDRERGGHWQGLLVQAEEGTRVEAVSHGRVVFADWLRGLGLLLIIDHGDGHLTLYGYNQSLYKDVGDWVDEGDVIARVGDTGGHGRAGLYFELRVDGEPQDPRAWLQRE